MKVHKSIPVLTIVSLSLSLSCSDFLQVNPPTNQIGKSVVFSDNNYAEGAVTGIYSQLSYEGFASGNSASVTMLAGFSADDFNIYTTGAEYIQFYDNSLVPKNSYVSGLWSTCYSTIYTTNSVIEGLNDSSGVSQSVKVRLMGEARFLRAFAHFYLTAMFGDVPIVTTTDVMVTRNVVRSPQADVYTQVERDLVYARDVLPESYGLYNNERVRATKFAASALLARLYLYKKDWPRAEVESSRVITNESQYELLTDPGKVFLKNSREAIWQLIPRMLDTNESFAFTLSSSTPGLVSLRDSLVNSFDSSDKRSMNWIDTVTSNQGTFYYPTKYHRKDTIVTEYSMVLRLAEQYLIRAEARVNQNKLTGSESAEVDINKILKRAGLPNTSAPTADALMAEVMRQRKLELFAEWGHRWFDLNRTNQTSVILQPLKPLWKSTSVFFPIPQYELINNHNLFQNDGYTN